VFDDRGGTRTFAFAATALPSVVGGAVAVGISSAQRSLAIDAGGGGADVSVSAGVVTVVPRGAVGEAPLRVTFDAPSRCSIHSVWRTRLGADSSALATFVEQAEALAVEHDCRGSVELDVPHNDIDVVAVQVDFKDGAQVEVGYVDRVPSSVSYADGADALAVALRGATVLAPTTTTVSAPLRIPAAVSLFVGTVAIDVVGQSTLGVSSIFVEEDETAPTVTIGSPVAGRSFVEGYELPIEVSSVDRLATIDVSVLVNSTIELPARFTAGSAWAAVHLPSVLKQERTLSMVATAVDEAGNRSTSAPVVVNIVPDARPAIAFTELRSPVQSYDEAALSGGVVDILQGQRVAVAVRTTSVCKRCRPRSTAPTCR
jgi:hypothetical protein